MPGEGMQYLGEANVYRYVAPAYVPMLSILPSTDIDSIFTNTIYKQYSTKLFEYWIMMNL